MSKQTERLLHLVLLIAPYSVASVLPFVVFWLGASWVDNGATIPGIVLLLVGGFALLVLGILYVTRVCQLTWQFLVDDLRDMGCLEKPTIGWLGQLFGDATQETP